MSKQYLLSDLNQEHAGELFTEITGKKVLPDGEMYTIDAFFAKDENGYIRLYFYNSAQRQETIIKNNQ